MNTPENSEHVQPLAVPLERRVRHRVGVTEIERWREVRRTCKTRNVGNANTQWRRKTTMMIEEVRELQLECGHWYRFDLCKGQKYIVGCGQCNDEQQDA